MRDDIKQALEMARTSNPPAPQGLYSSLAVMGELLSGALDRIDQLEQGGSGRDFLANKDILGTQDILK